MAQPITFFSLHALFFVSFLTFLKKIFSLSGSTELQNRPGILNCIADGLHEK